VRLREIAACESAMFLEYQQGREAFVASYTTDLDSDDVGRLTIPAGGRLARWLRVNEDALLVPDTRGIFDYLETLERDVLTTRHVRVCVPLVAVNRLVGIMLLADPNPNWHASADDLDFLATCGRQAALACESAALQRAERERLRAAGRAQQLAVAGQLAAAVAHEVRNPLHIIRSSVQYALALRDPAKRDELLQTVIDEADRIEHTISGLLSLSRPHELALTEIDLIDVAERSVRLVEPYAESARVSVACQFECRPLPILGDPNELGQVFVNVMLNACQAMPQGGRMNLLSTLESDGVSDPDFPLGIVQVRDNGPGIDRVQLNRVFDPFFTTKPGGTGLGLPICLDIMTRHQGRIHVDSQVGHGTTVSIGVPLRAATWRES